MSSRSGVPRATYRLQFNRDFTFGDAAKLVDYLADLGISHLYASPFLQARRGSTHGYDITDHNRLNPEIGSDADFAALSQRLEGRDIGLILDFVPNHMGIAGDENGWWLDVLAWGEMSAHAAYFDIDWNARRRDTKGKVLLPVLGDQYGAILENGEIAVALDAAEGGFSARYYDHRFPISPLDYTMILQHAAGEGLADEDRADLARLVAAAKRLSNERARRRRADLREAGQRLKAEVAAAAARPGLAQALRGAAAALAGRRDSPRSWRRLHALLEAQSYRLAYWRVAADEINYRRFFNINELAGLRIELPELFERAHRLVFRLIEEGRLHALRIDHVDGLFDPGEYCRRLQERAAALRGGDDPKPFYIVVEKILARYENLPDWPVAGTTGYDYTNQVLGLFIDPRGERRLTRLHARVASRHESFDEVLHASKTRIVEVNLASETNVLARAFHDLALADWRTRDFTLNGTRAALSQVLAAFPVYRTYVDATGAGLEDRRFIDWAVAVAKKRSPAVDTSIFDFIHDVLTGDFAGRHAARREAALRTALRFQQLSGPVMAKGFEDTALYRYVRLVALNEVGGDPRRFGLSPAAYHHLTQERVRRWPHAMLATATHDTKRGEDARARLAVLSEIAGEWRRRVLLWLRLNRLRRGEVDGAPAPRGNDEFLFYQAAVGAWPLDLEPGDAAGTRRFAERLAAFMIKAVREGKEQSSWGNPRADYETALTRFVESALDGGKPNPFLTDLAGFVGRIARLGALNSLAQTALRLTTPGVPDTYQGTELWDFSLVDPDNRRPVDFALRRRLLAELRAQYGERPRGGDLAALARGWRDGREKLFLIWRVLAVRAADPALFADGDYQPLAAEGDRADHLCAFARRHDGRCLVAAVPRLVAALCGPGEAPQWGATILGLPPGLPPGRSWRNVLTGREHAPGAIAASELFADFPVAVLASGRSHPGGMEP